MIKSISGIRGIFNHDISLIDVSRFVNNFSRVARSKEYLLGRDTRKSSEILARAVIASLLSKGLTVINYDVISTPALFRESLKTKRPGIMITASHNEPEWNGLKFIINGKGVSKEILDRIFSASDEKNEFRAGLLNSYERQSYEKDLIDMFGKDSMKGIRVAVDFGGGAAIKHAFEILREVGCEVYAINDTPSIFSRKIDPISDELELLGRVVREKEADVGLAFDCDGDRLVILDDEGNKKSGDFLLTLTLNEILKDIKDRRVVVSVDTTQAVDELVQDLGGQVFRSKVGEFNVVSMMEEKGAKVGGEGSSGGLIYAPFNYCRDSLLAALIVIRAIRDRGTDIYRSVKSYYQSRISIPVSRDIGIKVMRRLQSMYQDADMLDGIKVRVSKLSWALIRLSGTENLIRISTESTTEEGARRIAESFSKIVKELINSHTKRDRDN